MENNDILKFSNHLWENIQEENIKNEHILNSFYGNFSKNNQANDYNLADKFEIDNEENKKMIIGILNKAEKIREERKEKEKSSKGEITDESSPEYFQNKLENELEKEKEQKDGKKVLNNFIKANKILEKGISLTEKSYFQEKIIQEKNEEKYESIPSEIFSKSNKLSEEEEKTTKFKKIENKNFRYSKNLSSLKMKETKEYIPVIFVKKYSKSQKKNIDVSFCSSLGFEKTGVTENEKEKLNSSYFFYTKKRREIYECEMMITTSNFNANSDSSNTDKTKSTNQEKGNLLNNFSRNNQNKQKNEGKAKKTEKKDSKFKALVIENVQENDFYIASKKNEDSLFTINPQKPPEKNKERQKENKENDSSKKETEKKDNISTNNPVSVKSKNTKTTKSSKDSNAIKIKNCYAVLSPKEDTISLNFYEENLKEILLKFLTEKNGSILLQSKIELFDVAALNDLIKLVSNFFI